MFKHLPLLWANLGRKKLRTGLTLASIIVAFLLFGLMQTLRVALTGSPELAGVGPPDDDAQDGHHPAAAGELPQPHSLGRRSQGRDLASTGSAACTRTIATRYPPSPSRCETFFDVYPEYTLPPGQKEAWLKDRTGTIVGKMIAQRFGWKVGDTIPMRSNIWVQKDGGNVWPMKVIGIYDAGNGDNQSVYFHREYLDESRGGGMQQGLIGWVVMRIVDPARADAIAKTIDAQFANSSTETKTATEKAFIQSFANQMGNIGALLTGIAGAVFFTMLLVTANTMGQSIRERLNEIGVMKTLGYSNASVTGLVLGEARAGNGARRRNRPAARLALLDG